MKRSIDRMILRLIINYLKKNYPSYIKKDLVINSFSWTDEFEKEIGVKQ